MSREVIRPEGVPMLGNLRRWLARRRARRAAVASAARHFESVTGQRPLLGWSGVICEDAEGFVVRICRGGTKPPRRTWYRVGADGQVRGELSFEEARRFGARPWW